MVGRRARPALVALLAVVALGACSAFGGSDPSSSDSSSSDSSSSGSSSGGSAAQASAAVVSASPGATVKPLSAIGSRSGFTSDRTPIQVDLNAVTVEPKFTRVTFTLWNKAELGGSTFNIFELFGDGVSQMTTSNRSTFDDAWTVDGVYLVDTENAKRYLAARTTTGACVCSNNLRDRVNPQQGVVLWALYQPLPANATTIDVSVPRVGLFEKVPVSR